MAKHRKSQRMFSREQRAANRAEVGKISAADRQRIADDRQVAAIFGRALVASNDAETIAEHWLYLREDARNYPGTSEAADALLLERVYLRLVGRRLTVAEAEAYEDRREQEREDAEIMRRVESGEFDSCFEG